SFLSTSIYTSVKQMPVAFILKLSFQKFYPETSDKDFYRRFRFSYYVNLFQQLRVENTRKFCGSLVEIMALVRACVPRLSLRSIRVIGTTTTQQARGYFRHSVRLVASSEKDP